MKKRAEATYWFLIELVAAMLLGYLAVDLTLALAQGTLFEKTNLAKNIGTELNALAAVPGDATIVFTGLNGYSVKVFANIVEVYEDESDKTTGAYPFIPLEANRYDEDFKQPEQLVFVKKGTLITISDSLPEEESDK